MHPEEIRLPAGYSLDDSDPEVLYLRRPDGWPACAFSASGATSEAVERAAREDLAGREREG